MRMHRILHRHEKSHDSLPSQAEGGDSRQKEGEETDEETAAALLDDLLWLGHEVQSVGDLPGTGQAGFYTLPRVKTGKPESTEPPERNIQILGLQNTGTNLLMTMLEANFGGRLRYYDSSVKPRAQSTHRKSGLWKHANLELKLEYDEKDLAIYKEEKVTALIMIRNGVSWLQSMRKAPYELSDCVIGSNWLFRTCRHRIPAGYNSNAPAMNLTSIGDVWNQWTQADVNAGPEIFDSVLMIRYEDLVEQPEAIMQRISEHLDIAPPKTWVIQEKTAKSHGRSHGRAKAVEILHSKAYLAKYTLSGLRRACSMLDRYTMLAYAYTDCGDVGLNNTLEEREFDDDEPDNASGYYYDVEEVDDDDDDLRGQRDLQDQGKELEDIAGNIWDDDISPEEEGAEEGVPDENESEHFIFISGRRERRGKVTS